jgi:hypothetical protein
MYCAMGHGPAAHEDEDELVGADGWSARPALPLPFTKYWPPFARWVQGGAGSRDHNTPKTQKAPPTGKLFLDILSSFSLSPYCELEATVPAGPEVRHSDGRLIAVP